MAMFGTSNAPLPLEALSEGLANYVNSFGVMWIKATISSFTDRGNIFGKFSNDQRTQEIDFAIWQGDYIPMPVEPLKFNDRVIALVKPTIYKKTGKLSVKVLEIRHEGIGELQIQIEALRKQLEREGLCSAERKKPLPKLPVSIGLVIGTQTAAEQDVRKIAMGLWPDAHFTVETALMQGEQCASSVLAALKKLEAIPEVEVIIVSRGGGSPMDLIGFSDEKLVRYVASMNTPVVSAIGHEIDHPVLDDVADFRASTPTQAAEVVVIDQAFELILLQDKRDDLDRVFSTIVERMRASLKLDRASLADPSHHIQLWRQNILAQSVSLNNACAHIWRDISLSQERDIADLQLAIDDILDDAHADIKQLKQQGEALSPSNVLKRGFSLVTAGSTVVKEPEDAPVGSTITMYLAQGSIEGTVTKHVENHLDT